MEENMEDKILFEDMAEQEITVYMGDGCDAQDVCTPMCGN